MEATRFDSHGGASYPPLLLCLLTSHGCGFMSGLHGSLAVTPPSTVQVERNYSATLLRRRSCGGEASQESVGSNHLHSHQLMRKVRALGWPPRPHDTPVARSGPESLVLVVVVSLTFHPKRYLAVLEVALWAVVFFSERKLWCDFSSWFDCCGVCHSLFT